MPISGGSSSSGTVTSVATGTGLTGGPITATGTISLASIADKDVLANTSGSSAAPVPTTLSVLLDAVFGTTQGLSGLYRSATAWSILSPGTAGQFLQTGGASANPSWASGNAGTVTSISGNNGLTGTVTSSGNIGLATIANHNLLANTSGSTAVPVATTLSALIDDAIGSTQGDILYRGASSWAVLAPGTNGQLLATGGASANPSFTSALPVAAINTQTTSYTLVIGDCNSNTLVEMNSASAVNLTVPPNSSVAAAVGTTITFSQYGAGQVTIVAGAGVTLRFASSLTTRAQYSIGGMTKRGTDEWYVFGDMT